MKKLTLVLLALVVALPLVAGDLDNAVFSISGDSSLIFGVDLVSMATGFQNANNAKLRVDFKPAATAMKSGSEEGEIYGEIKFKNIYARTQQINNATNNDADNEIRIVTDYAKIVGPTWWVKISAHDDNIDYENATQNGIIGVVAAWDGQLDEVGNNLSGNGGFEAGLSLPDVADFEVSLFSLTDWSAAETDDDKNAYGLKAEAILKAVPNLTFKAAVNTGFGAGAATTLNDDLGFGALVSYKIAVNDDISITPEVGVDAHILDADAGMDLAIGNGLKVTLPGSEIKKAEDGVKDDTGASKAWDDGVNSGLTLGWSYYMPAAEGADAELGLQAHVGLSMVENLEVALGFEAADIMNEAADMGLALYGRYTAGNFVPYAGLFTLLDNEANLGSDGSLIANAGFALNNILPLTSLMVDWNSGELSADDAGEEADLGILKVTVKVKY